MRAEFPNQFDQEAPAEADSEKYSRLHNTVTSRKHALAYVAPRGIGTTAWSPEKETHIRRRFMLLGQTLDGMRVWDARRAIQALRAIDDFERTPLQLHAKDDMAGIALYAALFEPPVERLELVDPPRSHRTGPDFLNVLRALDLPQTVAMVAEHSRVVIQQEDRGDWDYAVNVAQKLGWGKRVTIKTP